MLGLEKGTDCGLNAAELWLSRANNAKKGGLSGGCPVIINNYRELSNMLILGFYIKLQLFAFKIDQNE